MKEYVFPEDLDPLDQELHVLAYIRDNLPKNNKKMVQMSRYLRTLLPLHFIRSICDNLEHPGTVDPLKWMKACIREMDEYPKIMAQLIADGNHGMIWDKGTIYPICLKANPKWLSGKDSEKWTEEDECEIGNEAVKLWMVENRRRHFDDRYLLFDEFGFSGIARKGGWTIPQDEWDNKVKPLRDADRKAEKVAREISKYINGEKI